MLLLAPLYAQEVLPSDDVEPALATDLQQDEGLTRVEIVHLRCEFSGDDTCSDAGRDDIPDRLPQGPEGECHHRSHDPRRDRIAPSADGKTEE